MSLPGPSLTIVVPEKLACDVYIGCMPLRLPPFIPKAFPSVLAQLGVKHFYTLVQQPSDDACMYYDFLPANPEDPLVVAAALTGQRVKGSSKRRNWKGHLSRNAGGLERLGPGMDSKVPEISTPSGTPDCHSVAMTADITQTVWCTI